jgi:hypothetical protein
MTTNNLTLQPIHRNTLGKRMFFGALIALALITLFLAGVKNANPAWGKYWMIQPLLIVPAAGAMGGLFYYFMDRLRYLGGWKTVLAYVLSFFGYLVAIWLGTVLGLSGTLWN